MTIGLWVYCPSPMFSKTCAFLDTFTFFLTCLVFGTFTLLLSFPCLFSSLHPHFHKLYPQFKTFLNVRAVLSSAVFCSNPVLITTPSFSMQFFSFFGVRPSAPATTGMTLMLIMFHILLISVVYYGATERTFKPKFENKKI